MPVRSDRTATVVGQGWSEQQQIGTIDRLLELLHRGGVRKVTLRSYSSYRSVILSDRGSQYTVYTGDGVNTFDKGEVVVKCAKLPLGSTPLLESDQRRVRATALYKEVMVLSHPRLQRHSNIVSLLWYDFVDLGNSTFIPALVMEKATLGSLSTLLQHQNVVLGISTRVDICSGITDGLAALHRAGIAHGDVKPDNVLMFGSVQDEKYTPKIADYGSVIVLDPDDGNVGRYYGTPSRNAPEVGNQTTLGLDRFGLLKCDNYSLGLLIAEVVIGEWDDAWEGKSSDVLPAIMQRCLELQPMAGPAVDVVSILDHLLAMNLDDRCCDLSIVQQIFNPLRLEDVSLANINLDPGNGRAPKEFLRFRDSEDVAAAQKNAFGLSDYLDYDLDIELVAERDTQEVVFDRLRRDSSSPHGATSGKALFQLAIASTLGFGTPYNEDEALRYSIASAKKGFLPAMANTVAFHQALGRESELNSDEAVDWLFEAVAWGSIVATRSLATINPAELLKARKEFHKAGGYNQFFYSKEPPPFIRSYEFIRALNNDNTTEDLEALVQAATIYGDSTLLKHLFDNRTVNPNLTNGYGESLLVLACKAGHLDVLRYLVSSGATSMANHQQESPLHWLIAFDDSDVASAAALLQNEQDLSTVTFDITWKHPSIDIPCRFPLGTPMHFCVFADNGDVARVLSSQLRLPLNSTGSSESTPLEFGLSRRKIKSCREIISHGALKDVESNKASLLELGMNLRPETWISQACIDKNATALVDAILEMVLIQRPELLDEPDEGGFTPLMGAAQYHDEQTVKALLRHGCNVNASTSPEYDGRTALNLITENKMQYPADRILEVLIENKADLCHRSVPGGKHVLHFAARDNNPNIVRRLLDLSVNVDIQTINYGQTALHIAADYGSLEVAELLLQRGANVNAECTVGPMVSYQWSNVTALAIATAKQRTNMIRVLLRYGASITAKSEHNYSVIHFAVTESDPTCLENLLAFDQICKPAVLDGQTHTGVTAMHMCAANLGRHEHLFSLLKAGANPNLRTKSGHSPLDCARQTRDNLLNAIRLCDESLQANDRHGLNAILLSIATLLEPITRCGTQFVLRLGSGDRLLDIPITTQSRERDIGVPSKSRHDAIQDESDDDSKPIDTADQDAVVRITTFGSSLLEDDPVMIVLDEQLTSIERTIELLKQWQGRSSSDTPVPEGLIRLDGSA